MLKACVICGIDCSERPRVKDARGRYYCRPCYDSALEAQRARGAAASAPSAPPPQNVEADDPISIEDLLSPAPGSGVPVARPACPNCGRAVAPGAAICIGCGLRLDGSGKVLTARATRDGAESEGTPWLWLVYLYVMPRRFFRMFAVSTPALVAAVFFWLYGMAGTADQITLRMTMAQAGGRPFVIPDDWGVHLAVIAILGLVAALWFAGAGGWWYRLRIGWSGDSDPDLHLARRVYVMSSLVWAIPALVATAYHATAYDTPSQAVQSDLNAFDVLVLITAFWSLVTSFFGVCTVFEVSRWKAAIWFIALPALLQCAGIALLVIAAVALLATGSAAVDTPQRFQSATISFDYPGNWWIDDSAPDHDPDGYIAMQPMVKDASLQIMVFYSDNLPEGEIESSFVQIRQMHSGSQMPARSFQKWGGYSGVGRTEHFVDEAGGAILYSVFAMPLGDGRMLEVIEYSAMTDFADVEQGFELVRRTLAVK